MSRAKDILKNYDFAGWATRTNLRCSDGRTIMENAFAHNDGKVVPIVWMHNHQDLDKVLGHGVLKKEEGGMRVYGRFNKTDAGVRAKELVHSGDIVDLSIYANQLQQKAIENGIAVMHGDIKEVSLVLAGANPGAHIDSEIIHGEYSDEAAFIVTGEGVSLAHSESKEEKEMPEEKKEEKNTDVKNTKNEDDETIADVFETLSEKQKKAVYAIIGAAMEDAEKENNTNDSEGGNDSMKHNAFEGDNAARSNVLTHSDMEAIIKNAKRGGSLRDAYEDYVSTMFVQHDDDHEGLPNDDGTYATYGMSNIDYLFPEAKAINGGAPEFVKRDTGWVSKVMAGVHHTPFSRIKSVFADIRDEEARAKGYLKGHLKKDEVFALLKRTTPPTTVYKKQKIDRDDVVDITDFDVIPWIKAEMREMLDEEFARAYLFGDGRLSASDDKINEDCIRPAITDEELYTIEKEIEGATPAEIAENIIDGVVEAQDTYQGSGNITAFIKQSYVTKMLLLKDELGHRLYKNISELATAMSVNTLVKVPDSVVTEGYYGVALDLNDYNVGADKGGAVNLFDNFDIDYNQQKYLIESRCSGALVKPFSAIALKVKA